MTMALRATGPVVAALAADVERLRAAEPEVRADAYDSVHQMRVATRRLRSILRSYRRAVDPVAARQLGDELRWLGGVLGAARDAEVRADRFAELLAGRPSELIVGPVHERLVDAERARYADAHAAVLTVLDGDRYAALLSRLTAALDEPPRTAAAPDPERLCRDTLARDYRRLRRLVRAESAAEPAERVAALHDVRKGAKRLRYAAEAAQGTLGEPAVLLTGAAKRLQSVLGDHRDAVESQEALLAAVRAAHDAGESTFTYGLLHQLEDDAARAAMALYHPALESLTAAGALVGGATAESR